MENDETIEDLRLDEELLGSPLSEDRAGRYVFQRPPDELVETHMLAIPEKR